MTKIPTRKLLLSMVLPFYLIPLSSVAVEVETVEHAAYVSVMDCETRNPLAVIYTVDRDTANSKRYSRYIDDKKLMEQNPTCHPNTEHQFKTYQSVLRSKKINESFDVGHLAMSNHLDSSATFSKLANQFSNLAPQASKKNRKGGAWYKTEMIVECMRDIEPLIVIAGTIDDRSTTDKDYFVDTFGQTTPDHWYRVIYFTKSNLYKAWQIPNNSAASKDKLEEGQYDISIDQLDENLPIELEFFNQLIQQEVPEANEIFMDTKVGSTDLTCRGNTTSVS